MTVGLIVLLAVAILIYFGLGQRVLDRLRLTDRMALVFLLAMILGGFLPDIPLGRLASINIGGGIVPLVLVGYLWSGVGSREMYRSVIAVVVTAAAVYAVLKIVPLEPTYAVFLDPLYLVALLAGLVAYLLGRSRRGAFIAGVMAIILNDVAALAENYLAGAATPITIGGAGVFDAVVIAGFIALGLSEVLGETVERVTLGLGRESAEPEGEDRQERGENEGSEEEKDETDGQNHTEE